VIGAPQLTILSAPAGPADSSSIQDPGAVI